MNKTDELCMHIAFILEAEQGFWSITWSLKLKDFQKLSLKRE